MYTINAQKITQIYLNKVMNLESEAKKTPLFSGYAGDEENLHPGGRKFINF